MIFRFKKSEAESFEPTIIASEVGFQSEANA